MSTSRSYEHSGHSTVPKKDIQFGIFARLHSGGVRALLGVTHEDTGTCTNTRWAINLKYTTRSWCLCVCACVAGCQGCSLLSAHFQGKVSCCCCSSSSRLSFAPMRNTQTLIMLVRFFVLVTSAAAATKSLLHYYGMWVFNALCSIGSNKQVPKTCLRTKSFVRTNPIWNIHVRYNRVIFWGVSAARWYLQPHCLRSKTQSSNGCNRSRKSEPWLNSPTRTTP